MAKKLSSFDPDSIPKTKDRRFGIVVSEWNSAITNKLLDNALKVLKESGVKKKDIIVRYVPGSFELPLGAQWIAEADDELDGVICLGCIIQGETPHFTFISQSVAQSLSSLSLEYNIPFIFGVLTVNNMEQAEERADGKVGNKGGEAANAALKMALLQVELEEGDDDE